MLIVCDLYEVASPIGTRIRMAAFHLGMSEAALARKMGMKPQVLNRLVRGERPGNTDLGDGESRLQKIAKILKVPVEWLTSGVPQQPWEQSVRDAMINGQRPPRAPRGEAGREAGSGSYAMAEVVESLTAEVVELRRLVSELREENRRLASGRAHGGDQGHGRPSATR